VLVGAHTKRNEVKKKSIEGQDWGGGLGLVGRVRGLRMAQEGKEKKEVDYCVARAGHDPAGGHGHLHMRTHALRRSRAST
jgi:hypothetical protein